MGLLQISKSGFLLKSLDEKILIDEQNTLVFNKNGAPYMTQLNKLWKGVGGEGTLSDV